MAQWVKYLVCKDEDLSEITRTLVKVKYVVCSCKSSIEETGESPGYWPGQVVWLKQQALQTRWRVLNPLKDLHVHSEANPTSHTPPHIPYTQTHSVVKDIAQLILNLYSLHKALGSTPSTA